MPTSHVRRVARSLGIASRNSVVHKFPNSPRSDYDPTEVEVDSEIEENGPTATYEDVDIHADVDIEGIAAECGVEITCENQCKNEEEEQGPIDDDETSPGDNHPSTIGSESDGIAPDLSAHLHQETFSYTTMNEEYDALRDEVNAHSVAIKISRKNEDRPCHLRLWRQTTKGKT
ncbi:hypothetical protein PsorP6_000820 [Peronosclerospora sorghi]|uniref:Uncharacterized protein n=1 Tax=Peronosclerospora sorghi TaxID=230839 RepID=A0ACC0WTU5_9STRA|nr:hypothetical protein PsorP6_000820 [Peronosclerospora sorghi]